MAIPGEVWGLNPNTGKLVWYADALQTSSICSSVVADQNGVVYAIEVGRDGGGGIAIEKRGQQVRMSLEHLPQQR